MPDKTEGTQASAVAAALDAADARDAEAMELVVRPASPAQDNLVLSAAERVAIARHPGRPGIAEIIDALFTDFFEQRGDRSCKDDPSIMGGVALYHGRPVTVLGNRKGGDIDERVACNFGMASPEGYRKAQRIMNAAQKFGRPIFTFVDTSGAYPGLEAEAHGQGEAIARSLALMSALTVPVICGICGEGGSGGALALAVGNRVIMLENAVYSVLSPEGFASILWKDASRADEACEVMKLTANDLLELGVIDAIIPEPAGGAHENPQALMQVLDTQLSRELAALDHMRPAALAEDRYRKFRAMGTLAVKRGRP